MKTARIEIRNAQLDDVYQIAAFLDDCWKVSYRNILSDEYLDGLNVKARYAVLHKRYTKGFSDFQMMHMGTKLIGIAIFGKSFTEGYEDDGEISALYLIEDYIGNGFGHHFLKLIEQALKKKRYRSYILDVLTENARAIRFYQAHGYIIVDNRSIRLNNSDYPLTIMRKTDEMV